MIPDIRIAAIAVLVAMGAGYLIFLVALWLRMERDRTAHEATINEMLERLPRRNVPASGPEN
jgi:hypothetical protein